MFKNKKNEKTKNINNDKIKEQKNVLMDEGEKKERKIMKSACMCIGSCCGWLILRWYVIW